MSTTSGDEVREDVDFIAYQQRLAACTTLYTKFSIADLIVVLKDECALWGPMLDNQDATEEEFQNKITEWSVGHSKAPIL